MTATFHQLSPPLPIETPHGKALAHFLLDSGPESHVLWGCFIDATRECWWVPNPDVRAQSNPSMGRTGAPLMEPFSLGFDPNKAEGNNIRWRLSP